MVGERGHGRPEPPRCTRLRRRGRGRARRSGQGRAAPPGRARHPLPSGRRRRHSLPPSTPPRSAATARGAAGQAGREARPAEAAPPLPGVGTGQRSGAGPGSAETSVTLNFPAPRPACPHTPPACLGPRPSAPRVGTVGLGVPRPGSPAGRPLLPSPPPRAGTHHAFLAEEAEEALVLLRGEQQRAHIGDPPRLRGLLLRVAAHGRGRPGAALAALRLLAPAAPSASSSSAAAAASQQPHRGASLWGPGKEGGWRGAERPRLAAGDPGMGGGEGDSRAGATPRRRPMAPGPSERR